MKKYGRQSGLRHGILFLALTIVLLAVLACGATLWERQLYAPVETTASATTTTAAEPTETATIPPTQLTEPAEETMPTLAADAMNGKQVLNILITGQDRRDSDSWGRSDTMILCSINAENDTVTMVSFLRDLYLKIPGYGSNRLNAAYSWGGTDLLNETLVQNFDVSIDGNIEIDFFDFTTLIDYLGGVDIELTTAEAEYLNKNGNWDVETEAPWALHEGENHLTGSQALAYSRIRYLDSDFVRTERQRKVLTQVLGMLQELSWNELLDAMDVLLENSTMSFTEEELVLYTLGFYPVLMDGEVVSARIPADGTWSYDTVSGMSVVKADLEENSLPLKDLLRDQS